MLLFELTKDTPYLALSGELWSVFCEYFNRIWPCYKGFLLYQLAKPWGITPTVYPKKYAHGFVVLCFVVVMQSFIMNSHEVFIHIHQGCFAGTGAIVRLPQCQWSKPDGYGKISQCITTTKHSKAKTVCIFHGIYCTCMGILPHAVLDVLPCLYIFSIWTNAAILVLTNQMK